MFIVPNHNFMVKKCFLRTGVYYLINSYAICLGEPANPNEE